MHASPQSGDSMLGLGHLMSSLLVWKENSGAAEARSLRPLILLSQGQRGENRYLTTSANPLLDRWKVEVARACCWIGTHFHFASDLQVLVREFASGVLWGLDEEVASHPRSSIPTLT